MLPCSGCFLIASTRLTDAHFARSVVYLVDHDEDGTLGFIVNRPLKTPLGEIWEEAPSGLRGCRVAAEGGPVEGGKGLLLHADLSLAGAQPMGCGLAVGGDEAALALRFAGGADAQGPRLFLGHSGWAPGQLDQEILQGAWTVRPGELAILLAPDPGEGLWERLASGRGGLPEPSVN